MRESIGGTWLLGFVVLFIVLFSAFLAFSINYTKAFKVKNFIINTIEENDGFSKYSGSNISAESDENLNRGGSTTEEKVYYYLKKTGYATTTIDSGKCEDPNQWYEGGYCVKKIATSNGAYYKVTTFINIEIPLIWQTFTIPIKGETKVLYYTND